MMTSAPTSPNLWLGTKRGYLTDHATQVWVRTTGRKVAWAEHAWLDSPWLNTGHETDPVAGIAQRMRLTTLPATSAGLVERFDGLASETFDPEQVHPEVAAFYECTSAYSMDIWSKWALHFQPFGRMLSWMFSRRLGQLNIPLDPLDTSSGMTSEVVPMRDESGLHRCSLWRRRLVGSDSTVYLGYYSTAVPPGLGVPCVHVAFPLPNGSATVILRPVAKSDGSLELISKGRRFGDPGFYFTLRGDNGIGYARFVRSATERIRVFVDKENTLRAEHNFRWFGARVFELRYKLNRGVDQPATSSSAG